MIYNEGRYLWHNFNIVERILAIFLEIIWVLLPAIVGLLVYIYFNDIKGLYLLILLPLSIGSAAVCQWAMMRCIKF